MLFFSCSLWADDSSFCQENNANFTNELSQPLSAGGFVNGWGPKRNQLLLTPNLQSCMSSITWQRQRIIAAAEYWIRKKLNYCHHYLPNYFTPENQRHRRENQGGYCNPAKDLMPNSIFYQQVVRWNYNNTGDETKDNWQQRMMWRGIDCSNYTTLLYNFAFGQLFSSQVRWQAGQRKGKSQINLSPNQQAGDNILDNPQAAGRLVCADNTLEQNHSCNGHGGYLSVIDQQGQKHPGHIQAADLAALPLHPGDLLFIAATRKNSLTPSLVTHVAMWTGKKVGYGPQDISPSRIAPNALCQQELWQPHIGDWVITDSHYQGADYRTLTPCFYLNNLWGVRRVIY